MEFVLQILWTFSQHILKDDSFTRKIFFDTICLLGEIRHLPILQRRKYPANLHVKK